MYFEEQGPGFRCPQCSGPRRRYAKKVGDRVGTTLDGGDAPILIFSFGGVALTIAFGIWAVNNFKGTAVLRPVVRVRSFVGPFARVFDFGGLRII